MPTVEELQPPRKDTGLNPNIVSVPNVLAVLQNLPLLGSTTRKGLLDQARQGLGVGLGEAAIGAGALTIADALANNLTATRRNVLKSLLIGAGGVPLLNVLQPDSALAAPPPPESKEQKARRKALGSRELQEFLDRFGLGPLPKDLEIPPTHEPQRIDDPAVQKIGDKARESVVSPERTPITGIDLINIDSGPSGIPSWLLGIATPAGTNDRGLAIGAVISPTEIALAYAGAFPTDVFLPLGSTGAALPPPIPGIYPPKAIVIGGDRARAADEGRIFLATRDGVVLLATGNGTVFSVMFSPDYRYLYFTESDHYTGAASFGRINLENGTFTRQRIPGYYAVTGTTPLRRNPSGGYTNEAVVALMPGYFKINYPQNGDITMTQMHPEQGSSMDRLLQFKDAQNNNIVGLISYTVDPLNPNRMSGILYWNRNDRLAYSIRPNRALYKPLGIIDSDELFITSAAPDVRGNLFFMGITIRHLDGSASPAIEYGSISNPNDPTARHLIPIDGDFPKNVRVQRGKVIDFPNVIKIGEDRFLTVFVNSTVASEKGLYIRRITNGVNATDVWRKVRAVSVP